MTDEQYTTEISICRFCYLPIRREKDGDFPNQWCSNFEPPNNKASWKEAKRPRIGGGADPFQNFVDEPWWTECPGTSEEKKQFSSFGEWWTTTTAGEKDRDRGSHEPVDALSALVTKELGDDHCL